MTGAGSVISYDELKTLMGDSSELLLVDVRNKDEVARGKIPGSINMPLNEVKSDLSLDPEAFQSKFGVEKPSKDFAGLVFHCQVGRRGAVATETARSLGFTKARNYAGAYSEWLQKERK